MMSSSDDVVIAAEEALFVPSVSSHHLMTSTAKRLKPFTTSTTTSENPPDHQRGQFGEFIVPSQPATILGATEYCVPCTTPITANDNPPPGYQRGRGIIPSQPAADRKCDACQQTLPRYLFPKDKFAKRDRNGTNDGGGVAVVVRHTCRRCSKNRTAERCKQSAKSQIKVGRMGDSGAVRRPNNFGYCDYVDRLFGLDCFADIVRLGAFGSAKDVSESMAAIEAACRHGRLPPSPGGGTKGGGAGVACLCIGDGSTPRTAVLACFLRGWDCVSIDPALRDEWRGAEPRGVRGLVGYGGTLEDFLGDGRGAAAVASAVGEKRYDHLLLLCVHSHARLVGPASVASMTARYDGVPATLVSLPCCPRFRSRRDVGRAPDVSYEDDCVFSACRQVEVWNFD